MKIIFAQLGLKFLLCFNQITAFLGSFFLIVDVQQTVPSLSKCIFNKKFRQSDSFSENALTTKTGYCSRSSISLRA